MAEDGLTVVFMPESAYGPTNNCVGIGKLVDLAPPAAEEQEAGQFWTDFITETAPEFRKPTIEQLDSFIKPVWQSLIDGARYCQPQLEKILADAKPDVIVEDNVNVFPALVTHDAPWVRMASCNPLEIKDPQLPPPFSGYPEHDPSGWDAFRAEYE